MIQKAETLHEQLGRFILADGLDAVLDTEKSHGPYLYDAKGKREFLDLFSFFATQPLGFNHPKLVDPKFREQLGQIAVHRPTLSDIYTMDYGRFVETFGRIAGRTFFDHFFFVEGGALGVENALKVAFDWKVRKNLENGRGEKGNQVIHFKEAFHGRSGYTLSLTNTNDPNKHKYFAKFNWPRVSNPKLRFPVTDQVLQDVKRAEEETVREITDALTKNRDDIAALLIEPIQSEGGDNHFRKEFLERLRTLADENEFLLVFDEVQTGMGITGKMWCFEHFDVTPDVVAFGKKAQVAGCAATSRVDEVKDNVFKVSSRINSTWGGNLVDMVRCTRILEIIEEDKLTANATNVGRYLLEKVSQWSGRANRISNVRGRGLIVSFDLPDEETRNRLQQQMWKNGAIILPCGSQSLRFRPHLDFKPEHVDHAMEILEKSEKEI